MFIKLITLFITLTLVMQITGISYALRPIATESSDENPHTIKQKLKDNGKTLKSNPAGEEKLDAELLRLAEDAINENDPHVFEETIERLTSYIFNFIDSPEMIYASLESEEKFQQMLREWIGPVLRKVAIAASSRAIIEMEKGKRLACFIRLPINRKQLIKIIDSFYERSFSVMRDEQGNNYLYIEHGGETKTIARFASMGTPLGHSHPVDNTVEASEEDISPGHEGNLHFLLFFDGNSIQMSIQPLGMLEYSEVDEEENILEELRKLGILRQKAKSSPAGKTISLNEKSFRIVETLEEEAIDRLRTVAVELLRKYLPESWFKFLAAIKDIINPKNGILEGTYLASGPDLSSYFYLSNATKGYFITREKISSDFTRIRDVKTMKQYFQNKSKGSEVSDTGLSAKVAEAIYTTSEFLKLMDYDILTLLIWELLAIEAGNIVISRHKEDATIVKIDFDWSYYAKGASKRRQLFIFSETDINETQGYIPMLPENLDFCMEKAMLLHEGEIECNFREALLSHLRQGGLVITDKYSKWLDIFTGQTSLAEVPENGSIAVKYQAQAHNFGHDVCTIARYDPYKPKELKEESWDTTISKIAVPELNLVIMEKAQAMIEKMEASSRADFFRRLAEKISNYISYNDSFCCANLYVFIAKVAHLIPQDEVEYIKAHIGRYGGYHLSVSTGYNDNGPFELAQALVLEAIAKNHSEQKPDLFSSLLHRGDNSYSARAIRYSINAISCAKWDTPNVRAALEQISKNYTFFHDKDGRITEEIRTAAKDLLDSFQKEQTGFPVSKAELLAENIQMKIASSA